MFAWIAPKTFEPEGIFFRYLYKRQPLIVMKHSPKLAILQSLDALDLMQMEEVLTHIKSLLQPSAITQHAFKKEAMKEIRQALRKGKKGLQLAA